MNNYHLHNRPDRELTEKSAIQQILLQGKYAVISMCRDNEPYVLSLSYGYDAEEDCLYFHSAKEGLKMDFLRANSRVCATVINDKGYVHGECAHAYASVVFWGEMHVLEDMDEKSQGMRVLLQHLEDNPAQNEERLTQSEAAFAKMAILKLQIDQIHAKAGR